MPRFQSWTRSRLIPVLGLVLVFGVFGCGPSTPNTMLEGVVKIGDKPLPGGEIKLIPQEGSDTAPRTGLIGPDGHYGIAPPIPVGAAKFTVTGPTRASNPSDPPPAVTVPAKYADAAQSGLTFTIKEGKNSHDFELAP